MGIKNSYIFVNGVIVLLHLLSLLILTSRVVSSLHYIVFRANSFTSLLADLHQDIMGNFLEKSKKSSQSFKKLSTFFREKIRLCDLEWSLQWSGIHRAVGISKKGFCWLFFKIWQAQKILFGTALNFRYIYTTCW